MEVESGPDADSPRPIGVGLLLCMLERGGEAVVQVRLLILFVCYIMNDATLSPCQHAQQQF